MMDTLAVALRVAEEAVEEAISKAETYSDSLVILLKKSVNLNRTIIFLLIWIVVRKQVDMKEDKVVAVSCHT